MDMNQRAKATVDEATEPREPLITVNGEPLSFGQSMAVRVAVTSYYAAMATDPIALGDDEHGRVMVQAYGDRLGEVIRLMARDW